MNEKSLSNTIENLQHQDPHHVIASLTKSDRLVFNLILSMTASCPTVYISQPTMASKLDISPTTVTRAIAKLLNLRLIHQNRRFNNSSYTYITPFILSNYFWHSALTRWFSSVPRILLKLALLGSTMVIGNDKLSPDRKSFINVLRSYEGVTMGHEASKERKVRNICKALIAKGGYLTNDECLNLMAFPEDVLTKASTVMKERQNVQYPVAYFMGMCRQLCTDSGRKPDWTYVQVLRDDTKLVLLQEGEEKPNFNGHEPKPVTVHVQQPGPLNEVRRNAPRERREPECIVRGRSIDVAKEMGTAQALLSQQTDNPFAQILVRGWSQQQGSTELKESDSGNRMIASDMKKIDPIASLQSLEVGEWYEEEICGEGEYTTPTPVTDVPGTDV